MQIRLCFTVLIICVLTFGVQAQDFKSKYAHAKDLFDNGKYALAFEAFKPLMVYESGNIYTEYAAFYYALSALKDNYKTLAKNTFLGIEQSYPTWNQIDQVRYWLAYLYFDQGEYFRAMEKLSQIRQDKGQQALKESYLSRIRDPEILRMLLEDFQDPMAAKQLIRLLLVQRKEEAVMEARRLMGTYGFSNDQFEIPQNTQAPVARRVSVLFPFLAQTLEPTPATKRNQYALDLYHGMKLAADSLTAAGIPVELALYDTERNPDKVRELLSHPELKSSDVIVGPLFNDEIKSVKEFSVAAKIPMIHPVSNSPDYLAGNPNALLFQPSWITLGRKSAEYLASLNLKKPCIIFYEKTPRDSTMAHAFKTRAEELKIPVVLFKEVTKENSAVIGSILTTPVKYDKWRNPIEFKLKKDSLGSIFVASDAELIFTKVIAAVDARDDDTILIGQETWLEKPGMDWIKFESLKITLASPNFYNPFDVNFKWFQKRFMEIHRAVPGLYSRIGFDFMMFLGKQLDGAEGMGLRTKISSAGRQPGFLFQGYESKGQADNQVVPFVRFTEGQLIRVH